MFIKQKGADVWVIDTEGLLHLAAPILEHPDMFEVVEGDPPQHYERLNYTG